jgi:hypothetical protein
LVAKVEVDWRAYGFDEVPLPCGIVYLGKP